MWAIFFEGIFICDTTKVMKWRGEKKGSCIMKGMGDLSTKTHSEVPKFGFDSNTQRHRTFTQQITINWHKNHKGVTNITRKHKDKHSKTRQHKWVTAASPQAYIHNVQTQNTHIPNSLKLKPIQHRTTHPTWPGTEATNQNQQKNSKSNPRQQKYQPVQQIVQLKTTREQEVQEEFLISKSMLGIFEKAI